MAIVEDISDEEPPLRQRQSRSTKSKAKREEIPLAHPSSVRSSDTKPLLSVTPPESDFDIEGEEEEDSDEYEFSDDAETSGRSVAASGAGGGLTNPDEIFNTLIYAVPFTFLYLLLDTLVHLQYAHRPTLGLLLGHVATALPTLSMIVLYTNRFPNSYITNVLLVLASILSGTRLIYLVNKASWGIVTAQAPAVGTLWIVTIVQLPLSRALLALLVVAGWCSWSGLKYMP